MPRNKFVVVSMFVAALLIGSFFVGAFYNSRIGSETYPSFESRPPSIPTVHQIKISAEHSQSPSAVERMAIYNGYVSLETSDLHGKLTKIRSLAESYGGYVASSSRTQDSAEITIRVPKDKFRLAVQEIEAYGKVLDERTSSEDSTEQYIDIKARLANLQRQENRLQEILGMAKTVDDVHNVERELERVRGDIEGLQGQINYLERNVAMSVVTVSLVKPQPPFTPHGMGWKETFETALQGLFAVMRGLIILSISLLPLLVIGGSAYYIYRKRQARKKPPN
jgi:hypothetical protein